MIPRVPGGQCSCIQCTLWGSRKGWPTEKLGAKAPSAGTGKVMSRQQNGFSKPWGFATTGCAVTSSVITTLIYWVSVCVCGWWLGGGSSRCIYAFASLPWSTPLLSLSLSPWFLFSPPPPFPFVPACPSLSMCLFVHMSVFVYVSVSLCVSVYTSVCLSPLSMCLCLCVFV